MWGYDGEDLTDIEATVEHVKTTLPDLFLTTVAYPIRGTPYYDQVASRLVAPDPWDRITDRELRIRGRHSRRFFQYADQLLKSEVALAKLMKNSLDSAGGETVHDLRSQIMAARQGLQATYEEAEA